MNPHPINPILSSLFICSSFTDQLLPPTVGFTDLNHRCQDIIPGLLLRHDRVGEHAAVPANMPESLSKFTAFVAKPVSSIFYNIQFTIRVERKAMPPGFIVSPGPEHRTIILGYVKIDGPWTQRVG